MSSDWTPKETAKKVDEDFVGRERPDAGWIFNSNWMDWNLSRNGRRAHVTFESISDETKWLIFDNENPADEGLVIKEGVSDCWQQAVLDSEKVLIELEQ